MPLVKKEIFHHRVSTDLDMVIHTEIKFSVNTQGQFYFPITPEIQEYFDGHNHNATITVRAGKAFASELGTLRREVNTALRHIAEAKTHITKERVIRFNIESHVSFATDGDDGIFPNAGYPGAHWAKDRELYGDHHSTKAARNGYSLTIGAKACTKITTEYCGKVKVEYEPDYGGGSHLGRDNPAQRLNSWCSFSLPENPREIPYSDEAAEFFFNLMFGMAKLSKMVQERTFETDSLLQLIDASAKSNALPFFNGN